MMPVVAGGPDAWALDAVPARITPRRILSAVLSRRRRTQSAAARPPTEAEEREGSLPPASGIFSIPPFKRFYEPDSIRVMGDALEYACRMLPEGVRASESLRRRLALHIMHDLDAGERDPARLAVTAVFSLRV
jgi:hypothetical protein